MPLLLALAGCTFSPGSVGFVTVAEATLGGELEAASFTTDLGYDVELDLAELGLGALSMQELSGGSVDFDPANPPEGYSLCHGGHCHRDDGALIDYADIIQELSGGAATFEEVAAFEGEHALDLLAGGALALADASPSPHLPIADITLAEGAWLEPGLRLEGWVTVGDEALPLSVALTPDAPMSGGLSLPVDRAQAAEVRVDFDVLLAATLLDGVELAELVQEGEVVIQDPAEPGGIEITERLLATELSGDADPME